MRANADYERKRYENLENILANERKVQYSLNNTIQHLENEKIELQDNLTIAERRIQDLQSRLGLVDSSKDSSYTQSQNIFAEMQRNITSLEKKLTDKTHEVSSLSHDNKSLLDENSKLKLSLYKVETERNELDRHQRLKESLGETSIRSSYPKDFEESPKMVSESGWEKLKIESDNFKRNLDDASRSSMYLKDKVKHLNKDFGEILPERRYKH